MVVLGDPSPVKWLANPGFELPADASGAVPGWETSPGDSLTTQLIQQSPAEGSQCLRLSNQFGTGWIASATNADLRSGRLYVRMALRSAVPNQAPSVQFAMEAMHNGQPYRRTFQKTTVTPGWSHYTFSIPSKPTLPGIPLDGVTNMRVRLEVIGPGVVDVDDVQVFDLRFEPDELTGLRKQLIWPTRHLHHGGQYAECHRILDGYWAEYLEDNVPLPANRIALEPSAARAPINTAPALEPPTPESVTEPPADEEKESGFINSVKRFFNWRF